MAKIDGAAIKESQLRDVTAERQLANAYMLQAAGRALVATAKAAEADTKAAGPDYRDKKFPQMLAMIEAARGEGRFERLPPEQLAAVRHELPAVIATAEGIEKQSGVRAEDARGARAVRQFAEVVLGEVGRRQASEKGEVSIYFANQPNRTTRDQLEYLLWKKKADQLGIRFTHEDVAKLVEAEFPPSSIGTDDLKKLADDVASKQNKKSSELYDALADEFRVRAAQAAVIGLGEVRDPAADPPATVQQRFEHFAAETTTTRYTFLTIPVEAYLPLVPGEPTEAELTDIFNRASGADPDPGSARPGIREPRKVAVQWVEVTGREPFYDALAVKRVQGIPAAQAVFGPALASVAEPFKAVGYDEYLKGQADVAAYRQGAFANPGKPELSFAGRMKVEDMALVIGAAAVKQLQDDLLAKGGANVDAPSASASDKLLDAEIARPDVAASLAGLTAGALATGGTPLAPAVGVTEAAYHQSRERRVVAGVQALHFPILPGIPELGEWVGGEAAVEAGSPAPLPEATVQPILDRMTADKLRAAVATEDVQAFEKELTRIMKQDTDKLKPDERAKVRKEAADYVAKWIAERGVKTGQTEKPRDVYTLADDPGLAPLLAKDTGVLAFGVPKHIRAKAAFGQAFVNDGDFAITPDFQISTRLKPAVGVYQVREYDPSRRKDEREDYAPFDRGSPQVTDSKPLTLVWRTAEVPADRPLSLAASPTAREKCKAIWRLEKARKLARKAADEAAEVIAQAGGDEVKLSQQVREALDKAKADVTRKYEERKLTPDPVVMANFKERSPMEFEAAKLILRPPFGGFVPMVGEFNPRHDETIVYETEKMKDDLMANKDKPIGSTFVFTDRPETTYFLTVVAAREPKNPGYFRDFVLYPDRDAINKARQQLQIFLQIGQKPPGRPLAPEEVAPRFAAAAREADRKRAVSLLKAEFNYTDENPKVDEKREQ